MIQYDNYGRMKYNQDLHENVCKPYTTEEIKYICQMRPGMSWKSLSLALGRTEASVSNKYYKLKKEGVVDKYKEKAIVTEKSNCNYSRRGWEMYDSIKEIIDDLAKKNRIKNKKDLRLHVESKIDQYCLEFTKDEQKEKLRDKIISEAMQKRKIKGTVEKGKKNKKEKRIGIIIVDFRKENDETSKIILRSDNLSKACKEMCVNITDIREALNNTYNKYNCYYMPKRKLWLITDREENQLLLEHIDEIVENARELYGEHKKNEKIKEITLGEAIDIAIEMLEDKVKREYFS